MNPAAPPTMSAAELQDLYDSVARFAREEIAPHVNDWDAAGEFPRALYRRTAELGLLAIGYPEHLGGTPAGYAMRLPVWVALALVVGPHMRAPVGASAWLSLVLVQPLLEELVLRGLVQGLALGLALGLSTRHGVALRLGPLSVANALTTGLFVALHLPHQPLPWALAVALPSLVLGHLRERLGSVWPGVLLHAIYNLGFGLTAWGARLLA